jgi:hypothetical protein
MNNSSKIWFILFKLLVTICIIFDFFFKWNYYIVFYNDSVDSTAFVATFVAFVFSLLDNAGLKWPKNNHLATITKVLSLIGMMS